MTAVRTQAKYFVTLLVEDLPDILLFPGISDASLAPERVELLYHWLLRPEHDDHYQPVAVGVYGPRRLDDGSLDRRRESCAQLYSSRVSEWPQWLAELIAEHQPSDWDV